VIIRTKHFAMQLGYQPTTDLPYGLTIGFWAIKGRLPGSLQWHYVFHVSWSRPMAQWNSEDWMVNEPGQLRGFPIQRQGIKSSAWTGRKWSMGKVTWQREWSFRRYA
jgi:hypothetical protein